MPAVAAAAAGHQTVAKGRPAAVPGFICATTLLGVLFWVEGLGLRIES